MPRKPALARALLRWYDRHKRPLPWRSTADPYRIWVSEMMLQQTQVKTVIPYYHKFLKQFPTVYDLARATEESVLKQWEGLGYYRRARYLHAGAKKIVLEFKGQFPQTPDRISELPGVGPYMLGAIGSIAFGLPLALVDGNVKRVFVRLFYGTFKNRIPRDEEFWKRAEILVDQDRPGDYNQALMELGATVCLPKQPRCPACPVKNFCQALKKDEISQAVYRKTPGKQPKKYFVALIVQQNNRLLLRRRHREKLLGGLWEFPLIEISDPQKLPMNISKYSELLGRQTHTYTHFKQFVEIRRWTEKEKPANVAGVWKSRGEIKKLPLSKINHLILSTLNP